MSIINAGDDMIEKDSKDISKFDNLIVNSHKKFRANSYSSVDFFSNLSKEPNDSDQEHIPTEKSSYCIKDNRYLLKEKIRIILQNLYRAYELNKTNKSNLLKHFEDLTCRQSQIQMTIEKIKRVNKNKQKKHVKYLRYIPLNKIYFYCPKKNHFYYILMDIVVKSRKKHLLGGIVNNSSDYQAMIQDEDEETEKIENRSTVSIRKGENISTINKSTLKRTINRYKFTEDEDEMLKKLIMLSGGNYTDWQKISKEFSDWVAHLLQDRDYRGKVKVRSILQLYTRSLEITDFYTYKKWTNTEDQILRKAILYYGPKNWQQISYCLEGRNNSQAFHRWMKGINPKIKRNKWSLEEDLTLGIALKIYGNKKWSKIANHLCGRTDIQCRERFCNILDPSLEEVEWKPQEDAKLLLLYDKMKNKWSKIAKEFGNRTDNTCWRRWKYLESLRKSMGNNFLLNNSLMNQHNTYSLYNTFTNNTHTIIDSGSEAHTLNERISTSKKKLKKKEIFRVRKMSRVEEPEPEAEHEAES